MNGAPPTDGPPDPRWLAYATAILEFPELGLVIDLRRPLEAPAVALLRGVAGSGELCVITPVNPRGRTLAPSANATRYAALHERLRRDRVPWTACDGRNEDATHSERGMACVMSLEAGRRLAGEFDQLALYHFDGSRLWLVPVRADAPPTSLPIGG